MTDTESLVTRDDYREADERLRHQIDRAIRNEDPILASIVREKLQALRDEAIAKFATPEVQGCEECEVYSVFGGPSHHARCKSGKAHCTCERCW